MSGAYATTASTAVALTVIGLAGNVVAELRVASSDIVACIKQLIRACRPSAPACWQRLIFQGRLLSDVESAEDLVAAAAPGTVGSISDEVVGPIVLQLVVAVNPFDILLSSIELAVEAAEGLDAMGTMGVAPHVARLFEPECGEEAANARAPAAALAAIESTLDLLSGHLCVNFRCLRPPPLLNLKAAFVPHAMDLLRSGEPTVLSRRFRIGRIFSWLGVAAVPHLVAWIGLLPRPVGAPVRQRLEQLAQFQDNPRVRLAAKAALADKGGPSAARVDELAGLRSSLQRNIKATEQDDDRRVLEDLRDAACNALRALGESDDSRLRYRVTRALMY